MNLEYILVISASIQDKRSCIEDALAYFCGETIYVGCIELYWAVIKIVS